jgi:transcriptional regulator with XRE-family HTH domain
MLSALLKRHRESIGMTQEELADAAGVSARMISDV